MYVAPLEPSVLIPKEILLQRLVKEAPDFLAAVLELEIPDPVERLAIPAIETADKTDAANMNKTILETFIDDYCFYDPGKLVLLEEFYNKFASSVDSVHLEYWTKVRVGKDLDRNKFPKGRNPNDSKFNIGNISWSKDSSGDLLPEPDTKGKTKLVVINNTLYPEGTKVSK